MFFANLSKILVIDGVAVNASLAAFLLLYPGALQHPPLSQELQIYWTLRRNIGGHISECNY